MAKLTAEEKQERRERRAAGRSHEQAIIDDHMATEDGRLAVARSLVGYFNGRAQSLQQALSTLKRTLHEPKPPIHDYFVGPAFSDTVNRTWNELVEHDVDPNVVSVNGKTLTEARAEAQAAYDAVVDLIRSDAERRTGVTLPHG